MIEKNYICIEWTDIYDEYFSYMDSDEKNWLAIVLYEVVLKNLKTPIGGLNYKAQTGRVIHDGIQYEYRFSRRGKVMINPCYIDDTDGEEYNPDLTYYEDNLGYIHNR
jgi:hypothetical protein